MSLQDKNNCFTPRSDVDPIHTKKKEATKHIYTQAHKESEEDRERNEQKTAQITEACLKADLPGGVLKTWMRCLNHVLLCIGGGSSARLLVLSVLDDDTKVLSELL